jgi:hypothetical protein
MANPIHQLKQAIRLRNWPMVCEVYEELSGETSPESIFSEKRQTEVEFPLVLGTEDDLATLEQPKVVEPEPESPLPTDALNVFNELLQSRQPDHDPEPEPAKPQQPPHRANIEDFRVQREESRARSEGGSYTRAVPVEPIKNAYRDNLNEATRELRQDRILVEKGVRSARPPVSPRTAPGMVQVTCRECNMPKQVLAADAPVRKFATDDRDGATYICDGCIGSKAKNRRGG